MLAKLYFRYGAMGSSKTANALMVRYNYLEKGQNAILLKPQIENRDGESTIRSRIGLEAACITVEDFIQYINVHWLHIHESGVSDIQDNKDKNKWKNNEFHLLINPENVSAVIIDEAQFLTDDQVEFMTKIVDSFHISVICYGLRTDFTGHLFGGSKRLMELADVIEEIPTICWCGKKAHFNARIQDGHIVRNGEQIVMGGNDTYISLCRKHYLEGNLGIQR